MVKLDNFSASLPDLLFFKQTEKSRLFLQRSQSLPSINIKYFTAINNNEDFDGYDTETSLNTLNFCDNLNFQVQQRDSKLFSFNAEIDIAETSQIYTNYKKLEKEDSDMSSLKDVINVDFAIEKLDFFSVQNFPITNEIISNYNETTLNVLPLTVNNILPNKKLDQILVEEVQEQNSIKSALSSFDIESRESNLLNIEDYEPSSGTEICYLPV
jgi:hypothetical protein